MATTRTDMLDRMENGSKWGLSVAIKRANPVPLDQETIFGTLEEAQTYASTGATAYPGQILSVVPESGAATVYVIQENGTLTEVGSATDGDDKTIILEDGVLGLYDYGKRYYRWISGEDEQPGHHELTEVSEEYPWKAGLEPKVVLSGSDLVIGWYEPNPTTIEGVNSQVNTLTQTVTELQTNITNTITPSIEALEAAVGTPAGDSAATGLYKEIDDTKTELQAEINSKVAGAFHFRGEASRFEDGVLYHMVEDSEQAITASAGDVYQLNDKEYAYDGTEWVELGFSLDLSNYYTKVQTDSAISTAISALSADGGAIKTLSDTVTSLQGTVSGHTTTLSELDGRLDTLEARPEYTSTEKEKLAGIAAGAQVNVIESVTLNGTSATMSGKTAQLTLNRVDEAATADKVANALTFGSKTFDGSAAQTITATDIGALTTIPDSYVQNSQIATGEQVGLVLSSAAQDNVSVNDSTGVMTVNTISASKIVGSVASAQKVDSTLSIGGKTFDGSAAVSVTLADMGGLSTATAESIYVKKTEYATAETAGIVMPGTEFTVGTSGALSIASIAQTKVSGLTDTIATAKSEAITDAVGQAKTYSDTNLQNAKTYTDTRIGVLGENEGGTQKTVKEYVDDQVFESTQGGATQTYVDSAVAGGLEDAKEYTDGKLADYYTSEQVDGKLASVFHYKGAKASYEEVQAVVDPQVGDVYQVNETEYVWTGTEWEVLGTVVDLSAYQTTAQADAKYVAKVEGSRLMTEAEGTKLAGIAENAQVNVIESVRLGTTDGALCSITSKAAVIPIATASTLGLVMSSTADDSVAIGATGTMTMNRLNATKLYLGSGDELILNGGSAVV